MFLNDCYCHLGLTFGENDLLKKLGGEYAFRFHYVCVTRTAKNKLGCEQEACSVLHFLG